MPKPERRTLKVKRDDLDDAMKRIRREGKERWLSIAPDGDRTDRFVITLEKVEPRVETR